MLLWCKSYLNRSNARMANTSVRMARFPLIMAQGTHTAIRAAFSLPLSFQTKARFSTTSRSLRMEDPRYIPYDEIVTPEELKHLYAIEKKLIWLSSHMIHNANNIRPKRDGLKVGGHQASSTSLSTIMTALYFKKLEPQDRVAVKPHASPIFHSIQYLMDLQTKEKMERFRAFGGVQSYPSRTKDIDDVDFSTGSVGLGAAITTFSALVQDYLALKGGEMTPVNYKKDAPAKMITLVGDAELDEGNVFEALLESWKHGVQNNWWIIDYNRQSLDKIVSDQFFRNVDRMFRSNGFQVVVLKYGKKLLKAFDQPGGKSLKYWFNDVDNETYAALSFKGGAAFREAILADMPNDAELQHLLSKYDDNQLFSLMTNLGGHDLETILEAFEYADPNRPVCFIAYTLKGYGLPLAGHRDNHGGLMNVDQMNQLQTNMNVPKGQEWDKFAGLDVSVADLKGFLKEAPFYRGGSRAFQDQIFEIPNLMLKSVPEKMSTQEAFGRIMLEIGRSKSEFANRVVTTSPDVATSTNLGGWINQRGIFGKTYAKDTFKENKIPSIQKWETSPTGQHIELGIAENNLFLMIAALGLSNVIFGKRLFPVGTLYDPFIARGLDALNYGCYQNSRFMLVATPSGISLAPEGGAHQSINSPLIAIGQPGIIYYEPSYADELAIVMRYGFEYMQEDDGGSVYLRLSTRPLVQLKREITPELEQDIIDGGYWHVKPSNKSKFVIVYSGTVAPEAMEAYNILSKNLPGGLLTVTSSSILFNEFQKMTTVSTNANEMSHIEDLLKDVPNDALIITVQDAHPAALNWLGSVYGHKVRSLGVNKFGQSGDIVDLYHHHKIDAQAIIDCFNMSSS